MQKFPPANGSTTSHEFCVPVSVAELVPDKISKQTLVNFWRGQGRNTHKQPWAIQNLATIDPTWCENAFIGDTITIIKLYRGIIPMKSEFGDGIPIIPGSETWASSALVLVHGKEYKVYITSQPMPQVAIDVILIARMNEKLYVKLLKRGSDPNTVDFPSQLMSGAGEHLEPGTANLKAHAERAIAEETGLDPKDFSTSQMFNLGEFKKPARDPRYWTFDGFDEETGEPIKFGMERGSSTTLKLIFMDFPGSRQPIEKPHTDQTEVAYTFWEELDLAIKRDSSEFIIMENYAYLEIVRKYIRSNGI